MKRVSGQRRERVDQKRRTRLALVEAVQASDGRSIAAIRGERRLHWIAQALSPLEGKVESKAFRRLTNALALCVGTEAQVALRDLCGRTREETRETLLLATHALLAHLSEAT